MLYKMKIPFKSVKNLSPFPAFKYEFHIVISVCIKRVLYWRCCARDCGKPERSVISTLREFASNKLSVQVLLGWKVDFRKPGPAVFQTPPGNWMGSPTPQAPWCWADQLLLLRSRANGPLLTQVGQPPPAGDEHWRSAEKFQDLRAKLPQPAFLSWI